MSFGWRKKRLRRWIVIDWHIFDFDFFHSGEIQLNTAKIDMMKKHVRVWLEKMHAFETEFS